MDLIEDLGTDVAVALFVDRKHLDQIEASEAMGLIGRIRNALDSHPDTEDLTGSNGVTRTASA